MIKRLSFILLSITTLLLFSFTIPTISAQEYPRCISFDQKINALTIYCDTNISQVDRNLRNKAILFEESDGVWILNASMIIDKDANLTINSNDTKWLKITNYGDNIPNSINISGKAKINGVKITSWNSSNSEVIKQNNNGTIPRPFIYVESEAGPVDISNSEVAFLGYKPSPGQGISYHGGNGSNISNNIFHHLWYGFYSNSIENVTISNNRYYNNSVYGIDPHSGTHDINILNNDVFNQKLGIICSDNCYNILFDGNNIYNSEKAGLMFSRNTSNSIAKNNYIEKSRTGISVSESNDNFINNNFIRDSKIGIKVRETSANNSIFQNNIDDAKRGMELNSLSRGNTIENNNINNVTYGIRVSNTSGINFFVDNNLTDVENYEYYVYQSGNIMIKNQTFTNDKIKGGAGNNNVTISESGIVKLNEKIIDTIKSPFNSNFSRETLTASSQ